MTGVCRYIISSSGLLSTPVAPSPPVHAHNLAVINTPWIIIRPPRQPVQTSFVHRHPSRPAPSPPVFPGVLLRPRPSLRGRRLSRLLFLMKCCACARRRLYRRLRILLIFIPCRAARRARYGSVHISGCDMDGGGGVGRERPGRRVGAIGVVRFVGWLPTTPARRGGGTLYTSLKQPPAELSCLCPPARGGFATPPPAAAAARLAARRLVKYFY